VKIIYAQGSWKELIIQQLENVLNIKENREYLVFLLL